ncbi:GtrA family protein [Azospirillaceae bacterium]
MRVKNLNWSRMTKSKFIRFGMVGVVGLVVDSCALILTISVFGLDPYTGRLASFMVAVTTTWFLNRLFTFCKDYETPIYRQWGMFVAANSLGGVINYSVYAALVTSWPLVASAPYLGVAAGSLSGLIFNYTASKKFVFRRLNGSRNTIPGPV